MKVVVTGASGHVGANLVRELLRREMRVKALVRRRFRAIEGLDIERAPGDVRDPESLRKAFVGADVVYHLASIVSIDGDKRGLVQEVNVRGARNVAEAALHVGVRRLVHCSSMHAFAPPTGPGAVDESHPPVAEGPAYDVSKAQGERAVLGVGARGLEVVIVNPTGVIGPHDFERSRMGRIFTDLVHRRLPSLIRGGVDWVDARDVCTGTIAAAVHGRPGHSYLLGGRWATIREVAEIVEQCTGVAAPRIDSPLWLARLGAPFVTAHGRLRGREPLYTAEVLRALSGERRVDCSKARLELDYQPRPLERTVRDTLRWFVEHGALPATALRRAPAGDTSDDP